MTENESDHFSMPKKKATKKLDLSHLALLKSSTPEPLENPEEPPKAPTSQESSSHSPLPELPKTPTQEESASVPSPVEPPNRPTSVITPTPPQEEPASEPVGETPASSFQEDTFNNHRYFDRKPQRKEIKPIKTLESAFNAADEVFQAGDKIVVKAPWGGKAIAEIALLYQDDGGTAWAQYLPLESIPPNWSWLGGCTRTSLLMKP